jgi:hypothetical protein
MADNDPLLKIKAKNKLSDIELQAELEGIGKDFRALMNLKAPELQQIVSPEELDGLIAAIRAGTASNNQLTKFISLADKLLAKI